tara:strand:+ start:458 stop:1405 length:948 start_codon:yes stop_codon:yes gene_type:complete
MDDLKNYSKKLQNWDELASVRVGREQYDLSESLDNVASSNLTWSLEKYTPIFSHKYLHSLTESQKQYVMAMQLLEFVEKTTRFELEYVNQVATNISLKKYPFDIPHQLILDAIKINTDEAYHAYFSEKIRFQIAEVYNESDLNAYVSIFFDKLEAELNKLSDDKRYLGVIATVVISETMIVQQIVDETKSLVFEPIRQMFQDHAKDEAYHCSYFITYFNIIWEQLSDSDKEIFGQCFHNLIWIFCKPRIDVFYYSLAQIGFSREEIDVVIRDTYSVEYVDSLVKSKAKANLNLFRKADVFENKRIKIIFEKSGLI